MAKKNLGKTILMIGGIVVASTATIAIVRKLDKPSFTKPENIILNAKNIVEDSELDSTILNKQSYVSINSAVKVLNENDEDYFGSIGQDGQIDFHVYSSSKAKVNLTVIASSTFPNNTDKKTENMQFNTCFEVQNNYKALAISDDTVVKGLDYPNTGFTATNWSEVNLGQIELNEGFNRIIVKRIGCIYQKVNDSNYPRVPNIYGLKINY